MPVRPNVNVTTLTPPATEVLVKTVLVARTDTTAFEAFSLPKGAVIAGAYVMGQTASNAGTTAIISVGSNPGTTNQCLASFSVKTSGAGYFAAGAAAGTSVGNATTSGQAGLSADTLMKAVYAETGTASNTGGPWLVKVEYYIPQQGMYY